VTSLNIVYILSELILNVCKLTCPLSLSIHSHLSTNCLMLMLMLLSLTSSLMTCGVQSDQSSGRVSVTAVNDITNTLSATAADITNTLSATAAPTNNYNVSCWTVTCNVKYSSHHHHHH